jgi:ribosomal protein S18 acetylase RimI-like enzyme
MLVLERGVMLKENLILESSEVGVQLRAIEQTDCGNLRQWKNANRFSFFSQGIITREQQIQWFENYLTRPDDYMFIASVDRKSVGCMGFRMIDHRADVYNVILGKPEFGGRGLMSQAMQLMASFIISDLTRNVMAHVLRSNPAIDWYRKNGFREKATHDNFVEIELDLSLFHPWTFRKISNVF